MPREIFSAGIKKDDARMLFGAPLPQIAKVSVSPSRGQHIRGIRFLGGGIHFVETSAKSFRDLRPAQLPQPVFPGFRLSRSHLVTSCYILAFKKSGILNV